MARLLVGLAALVAVTGFAPAPRPKPDRRMDVKELVKKLQGTWEIVSLERNLTGKTGRTTSRSSLRFRFEGEKWSYAYPNNNLRAAAPSMGGGLVLDTSKSPPAMDLVRNSQPGQSTPPARMRGIVKVEGDTIKFCYSLASEKDRPTSFDKIGTNQILMTLKRAAD
jgi:uncharacterized protein (TIGR03067 family)